MDPFVDPFADIFTNLILGKRAAKRLWRELNTPYTMEHLQRLKVKLSTTEAPEGHEIQLVLEDDHAFMCFQESPVKGLLISLINPDWIQVALLDGNFQLMYKSEVGYEDVRRLETNRAECLINELIRLFFIGLQYDSDYHRRSVMCYVTLLEDTIKNILSSDF